MVTEETEKVIRWYVHQVTIIPAVYTAERRSVPFCRSMIQSAWHRPFLVSNARS